MDSGSALLFVLGVFVVAWLMNSTPRKRHTRHSRARKGNHGKR